MKEFTAAKRHIDVSVGESVRILRELQELSQNELARALKCHPAVLLFPSWDVEVESAA